MNDRTASLRQVVAQMEEFSYSVSHDLRAPVRAMRGYADMLLQDHGWRLDNDARDLLATVLSNAGADVMTASNVQAALAAIDSELPDAIVCDVGMPGEDGHTFMRKLRSFAPERGGTIPSVALTAYARPQDADAAIEAGFLVHLAKPVDPVRVVNAVADVVQNGRVGGVAAEA